MPMKKARLRKERVWFTTDPHALPGGVVSSRERNTFKKLGFKGIIHGSDTKRAHLVLHCSYITDSFTYPLLSKTLECTINITLWSCGHGQLCWMPELGHGILSLKPAQPC